MALENDRAVVDVGLKAEGRISLKEFSSPGEEPDISVGDSVEVYLDRIENRDGEAVLSREKPEEKKLGKSLKLLLVREKSKWPTIRKSKGWFYSRFIWCSCFFT